MTRFLPSLQVVSAPAPLPGPLGCTRRAGSPSTVQDGVRDRDRSASMGYPSAQRSHQAGEGMDALLHGEVTKGTHTRCLSEKERHPPCPQRGEGGERSPNPSYLNFTCCSLLGHPSVCSWHLSHVPPPLHHHPHLRMLEGSQARTPQSPRSFAMAKAGWALTTSLSAPGILAVLWEGGLQLLIWGGKQSGDVRGRAERYRCTNLPGRQRAARASDCQNNKFPA